MLDILGNIDTVNYFIQDAIIKCSQRPLQVRSNLIQGDGYFVDLNENRKNIFNLMISAMNRNNIARIIIDKNSITVRYNSKFMITYKGKTNQFSTNLFEDPFDASEVGSTFFAQSTVFKFEDVNFNAEVMQETLEKVRGLYYGFVQFIEDRDKINHT